MHHVSMNLQNTFVIFAIFTMTTEMLKKFTTVKNVVYVESDVQIVFIATAADAA